MEDWMKNIHHIHIARTHTHTHTGILFSHNKEGTLDICDNMGEP